MVTQTLVNASPDDIRDILREAMAPLNTELEQLRQRVGHAKHAYTVEEAAEKIGFHTETVRGFIKKGRVGRKGKLVFLASHEITPGSHRITPADLDLFIAQF